MKKWSVLFFLFITVVAGCSFQTDEQYTYTVSPVHFKENEKQLLEAVKGEMIAAFDVAYLKEIGARSVELWVDHYEHGQWTESLYRSGTPIDDKDDGHYRLLFTNSPFEIDEAKYDDFHTTFISENGSVAIDFEPMKNEEIFSQAYGQREEKVKVKLDETITIAYIIQTEQSSLSPGDDEIFSVTDSLPQRLNRYEHVYLVRMKASK